MADYIKIRIRRDSASNWAAANPVLMLGEIAADMTKHRLKVGDGSSKWSSLPFYPEIVNDLTSGGVDKALSAEQGKQLKLQVDTKASKTELTDLETRLTTLINTKVDTNTFNTAISNLKTELTNLINGSKVKVWDSLDRTETTDALSAYQGRVLKGLIDSLTVKINSGDLDGKDGKAATIKIGRVTTGDAGSQASVTNVGTATDAEFNFTIPKGDKGNAFTYGDFTPAQLEGLKGPKGDKGDKGDKGEKGEKGEKGATGAAGAKGADGATPTIKVGTTTTGEPGTKASVTASTSGTTTTLNFTIPTGGGGGSNFGIFGIGYTIDAYTTYGKPSKITFEDGVTCDLIWSGTVLQRIIASTGEVMTINYNINGTITGRTITRS